MTTENAATTDKRISIQKIYIKDMSFESPNSPQVFTEQFAPQTQLNIRSSHRELGDGIHEVILTLTIEAKKEDKSLFLIELQQAGLFQLVGLADAEREVALGSFCPNILYPYARECIASTVLRGGFPEFILQPIDFDRLYAQSRQQRQQQQEQSGNGGAAAGD